MTGERSFGRLVRDALAHLYDFPYLQNCPLLREFDPTNALRPEERMLLVRTRILEAIEQMNTGSAHPGGSRQALAYNALNLHYVEGLSVQEVAKEMALSERQVYRELRRAEGILAGVLWSQLRTSASAAPSEAQLSRSELVLREAARLQDQETELDPLSLLRGVAAVVQPLASQRQVHLQCTATPQLRGVRVNRDIARQALVSMLSTVVRRSRPGSEVAVAAEPDRRGILIRIAFAPAGKSAASDPIPEATLRLIERCGGCCAIVRQPDGTVAAEIALEEHRASTVLVVDDHVGLAALFQRYLVGEPYRVLAARDGQEGLSLARSARPDVIVLDVMMPRCDGWEILQQLRADDDLKSIPIIVCSVLDDPDLAQALGATAFLAKPVSRDQLLEALARCLQQQKTRIR
ncbi:MAG: response regulator [Anaerolineae bacterium]|nr:response regulator [Anaerolineae bacterium]